MNKTRKELEKTYREAQTALRDIFVRQIDVELEKRWRPGGFLDFSIDGPPVGTEIEADKNTFEAISKHFRSLGFDVRVEYLRDPHGFDKVPSIKVTVGAE